MSDVLHPLHCVVGRASRRPENPGRVSLLANKFKGRRWAPTSRCGSRGIGRQLFAERLLCADIVAKVENRMMQKISRKLILSRLFAAKLYRADTKVRGRFCVKRCGHSRPRAQNTSAVLKNFVGQPKKDFFNTIRQLRSFQSRPLWLSYSMAERVTIRSGTVRRRSRRGGTARNLPKSEGRRKIGNFSHGFVVEGVPK